MPLNQRAETESNPAFEVHLGETYVVDETTDPSSNPAQHARHCIIWMNGKRWEGILLDETAYDDDAKRGVFKGGD